MAVSETTTCDECGDLIAAGRFSTDRKRDHYRVSIRPCTEREERLYRADIDLCSRCFKKLAPALHVMTLSAIEKRRVIAATEEVRCSS
jgi:hypothetical protein